VGYDKYGCSVKNGPEKGLSVMIGMRETPTPRGLGPATGERIRRDCTKKLVKEREQTIKEKKSSKKQFTGGREEICQSYTKERQQAPKLRKERIWNEMKREKVAERKGGGTAL